MRAAGGESQQDLAVGRALRHDDHVIVADLLPHAIQRAIEQMRQRMEPEHAPEELLQDHHPVIAPREVRGLVAEDREQLVTG